MNQAERLLINLIEFHPGFQYTFLELEVHNQINFPDFKREVEALVGPYLSTEILAELDFDVVARYFYAGDTRAEPVYEEHI